MLKNNKEKIKNVEDNMTSSVLQDAIDLSLDLEEEEQQGSFGQEDQNLLSPKQKKAAKKKISDTMVIRRSKRLKLKKGRNERQLVE
jgi:hypothetical protein